MARKAPKNENNSASWYARRVPRRSNDDAWILYDAGVGEKPKYRNALWEFLTGCIKRDPVCKSLYAAGKMAGRIQKKVKKLSKDYHKDQFIPDELFEKELEKLSVHFNDLSIPPHYRDWQAERFEAFLATCLASEQFKKAAKAWPDLPESGRRRFINNLISTRRGIYAEGLYEPNDYKIKFYQKPRSQVIGARYPVARFIGRTIKPHGFRFNTHKDAKLSDDFLCAVNFVQHECTHMDQEEFSYLYDAHKINPEHPLYEAARYWYLVKGSRELYIKRVKGAYFAHPMEVDAYAQGNKFSDKVGQMLNIQMPS